MWKLLRPLLSFAAIFALSAAALAESVLPPCPTSRKVVWTDCQGSYTYDDWSKYVGEFKNDKRHGQGSMTYADGQQYVGGFKADRRDGDGVFTGANGSKWVGLFRDDKPNGRGVLYDKTGRVLKAGVWTEGVYKSD